MNFDLCSDELKRSMAVISTDLTNFIAALVDPQRILELYPTLALFPDTQLHTENHRLSESDVESDLSEPTELFETCSSNITASSFHSKGNVDMVRATDRDILTDDGSPEVKQIKLKTIEANLPYQSSMQIPPIREVKPNSSEVCKYNKPDDVHVSCDSSLLTEDGTGESFSSSFLRLSARTLFPIQEPPKSCFQRTPQMICRAKPVQIQNATWFTKLASSISRKLSTHINPQKKVFQTAISADKCRPLLASGTVSTDRNFIRPRLQNPPHHVYCTNTAEKSALTRLTPPHDVELARRVRVPQKMAAKEGFINVLAEQHELERSAKAKAFQTHFEAVRARARMFETERMRRKMESKIFHSSVQKLKTKSRLPPDPNLPHAKSSAKIHAKAVLTPSCSNVIASKRSLISFDLKAALEANEDDADNLSIPSWAKPDSDRLFTWVSKQLGDQVSWNEIFRPAELIQFSESELFHGYAFRSRQRGSSSVWRSPLRSDEKF